MKKDEVVEVRNSMPTKALDSTKKGQKQEKEIVKLQEEVKGETHVVGIYQSAVNCTFFTEAVLESLRQRQKQAQVCVCLNYDLSQAARGLCAFKAYRLSKAAEEERPARIQGFFEEIPIRIFRPHLLQAFLAEHVYPALPQFHHNFFDIASEKFLQKSMGGLGVAVDDMLHEQSRMENAQKMKSKNYKGRSTEDPAALKMDLFIVSKQVDELCEQLNEFAAFKMSVFQAKTL